MMVMMRTRRFELLHDYVYTIPTVEGGVCYCRLYRPRAVGRLWAYGTFGLRTPGEVALG